MIGVHVATPDYLTPLFKGFFDPTPLADTGLAIPAFDDPAPEQPIYWNGDYSRLGEWVDCLIEKHQQGNYVALLIPMGDSESVRKLIRYGVFRLIPERRFFPEVRNVELVILTG